MYAARDERLGRTVAIKLVPVVEAEPVLRQRFIREARSAAGFSHPNAVAVFDAGEADDYLYLVMELVEGRSLAERLADGGPLDPAAATKVAAGVLNALAAAHAVGIVHRDVKPANIMLANDGGVKLTDFGIAKRLDDVAGDVTMVGTIVGTPKYLAPEQVGGEPATTASDVYAVGVVLYEMLAGRPPFDAETPVATAIAHRQAPVPDISAEFPSVPAGLALAIRTAMAKNPANRYDSARAMLAAVNTGSHPRSHRGPPTQSHSRPTPQPTQVMPAGGYTRSSVSRRWVAMAAALLAGATVLALLVVRDRERDDAGPAPSTIPAITLATIPGITLAITLAPAGAPSTDAPPTPTTAAAAIAPATPRPAVTLPANAPDSVEGVIAALQANPGAFGPRADDVIKELGKIEGNGRSGSRRAAELLDKAAEWVEDGELEHAVLSRLEQVLGPIVAPADDDDDDDDGDDDDD